MKYISFLLILFILNVNAIRATNDRVLSINEFVDHFTYFVQDDDDVDMLDKLEKDLEKVPDNFRTLENIKLIEIYFDVIAFSLSLHVNYVFEISNTLYHIKWLNKKLYNDEWISNANILVSFISGLEDKSNFTFYLMENEKNIPYIKDEIIEFIKKLLIGIPDDDKIEFLRKIIHTLSSLIKIEQLKNEVLPLISFTCDFSLINSSSIYTENFIENIEEDIRQNFSLLQQAQHLKSIIFKKIYFRPFTPSRSVIDLIFSDKQFNQHLPLRLGRNDVKEDENGDSLKYDFLVAEGGNTEYFKSMHYLRDKDFIGKKSIEDYFSAQGRANNSLYEYGMHAYRKNRKAIILEYYGGDTYHETKEYKRISELEKQFIENDYIYVDLYTLDNEKNIKQEDQFTTPEGYQLLEDTLVQFFLFIKDLKKEYPNQPIYYKGESFGGTKGILINLILSNIGHLDELFTDGFKFLANRLNQILEPNDCHLIDGYIFHDGWYEPFFNRKYNLSIKENHFKIKKPVLLLQNFDDENVKITDTVTLYNLLRSSNTCMNLVHLFVTPMAASKNIQERDKKNENSSDDAHHKPINKKYFEEYKNRIFQFLEEPFLNTYSKDRFKYAQKLTKAYHDDLSLSSRSLGYVEKEKDRTVLYRTYFAILHQETDENPLSKEERIIKTFAEYATYLEENPLYIKEKAMDLFDDHSLWLIYETLLKQKSLVKNVAKQRKRR